MWTLLVLNILACAGWEPITYLYVLTLWVLSLIIQKPSPHPTSVAFCLGINLNIQIEGFQILCSKYQEVLSLCNIYFSKSKISQTNLQALIHSPMFLHKAVKPASCLLTTFWLYFRTWVKLLKWTLMRALIRTADGFLLAPKRLMAPLIFLSVCSHGSIFL
jgi:hypothetical protein